MDQYGARKKTGPRVAEMQWHKPHYNKRGTLTASTPLFTLKYFPNTISSDSSREVVEQKYITLL